MNILAISTLPHYLTLVPLLVNRNYNKEYNYIYSSIILYSTTLSFLWHLSNQENDVFFFLDYFGACMWLLFEVGYSIHLKNDSIITKVFILNNVIYYLNRSCDFLPKDHYTTCHTIWHILSSMKCVYLARLMNP